MIVGVLRRRLGRRQRRRSRRPGTLLQYLQSVSLFTQIMTNPKLRANNQDLSDLYTAISKTTLPAVSIVKPDGLLDGHPASSKLDLFEAFTKKVIDAVQANPTLAANTAS